MDLGMLFQSLQETADKDSILEILIDIRNTVSQHGITFHNIQKFFDLLNQELQSKESQIILTVNEILIAVLNSDTPEVEPQFPVFFKSLLAHLEDVEVPVRESCLDVILQYIRQTRNIENVLVQYNKFGINSPINTVRKKSIKYLPVIIEAEKNVFNTPTGQYELRKTIENVIIHLKDDSDLVQKEAEKTLWILWKCYNTFEKIIGKLAIEHQLTFEKRITIEFERMSRLDPEKARRKLSLKNIPEVQRIFRMDAGLLERKEEELSPNKKIFAPPNTTEWPISKNGLYFGFVTAAEMKGMEDKDEWKKRLEGVMSIEEKMMAFREFFDLNAYLTSFVNFLKTLLPETHQPILLSLYTILGRAINITGAKNKIALHTLLSEVLPKLSDNRVVVRQECLYLCAEIATMMKLEVALAVLMKFLEPENDWHTKEEVLKLVIVCYLKTYNDGLIDFNQELILSKVSQLVDDESAKVRLGALETLTVICHSTRTTESLEILGRLVDRDAYEVVIDGLEQGKVAYVGDHKVIDFTREKYNFLLNRQKMRQEERLLVEIGSKDAQILNRSKEDDFDWEDFVMKEQEDGEVDSYEIGENAAGELIKDPDMDLKDRMQKRLKGPGIFAQKRYVEVVDGNTGEYKGYKFAGGKGKAREDANMVLFTKDIPEDVLKRMRGEDDDEEEVEEEKKVEEVPVEEAPKEPEDKDKDPETILNDIFDLGQGLEKENLTKDRFKMIGELKHYKRKKKNRTELYEEQPKDPQEELLMADEQLKPLAFPEFYLENIILDLRVDEWSLQFGALNNLRRVCLYSQEALYAQTFNVHTMIGQLLTVFRKTKVPILLRNILLGLKNLIERMGKILDPDVELIYTSLLTKATLEDITPRTFMEMKYCLGTFIQNLSDEVLVLGLGKYLIDKKELNQLMPILCAEKLLKKGNQDFLYNKGAGTMLAYVLKNMSSEEYEIRTVARRTFMRFIECGFERKKLERFFMEAVPQDDYHRISEYLRRTDEMMAKREKLPMKYKA